MVKSICEICEKEFKGEKGFELAKKCESLGIIGPKIKPGLVLSENNSNNFFVFETEFTPDGHFKKYSFFRLLFNGVSYNHFQVDYCLENLDKDKNSGKIVIPNQKDFNRISKIIHIKTNIMEYLKINGAKHLYKYHPYFDKSTTQ